MTPYEKPELNGLDDKDLENVSGGFCATGDTVNPGTDAHCSIGDLAVNFNCCDGSNANSGFATCTLGTGDENFTACETGAIP